MAGSKLMTLEQFKMLALRAKTDSDAGIAELAALVAAGLEDMQHVLISVVLPAANWNEGAQTVRHKDLLAESGYCYFVYGSAGIKADDVAVNGQITFRCDAVPGGDLAVDIFRVEVKA